MSTAITTSVVTGGTNSRATTTTEINYPVTDFVNPGVVGTIALNTGSGGTGSFAVNAQASPAMFVDVTAGGAYITATPSGQTSQKLRANMASNYTSYAISSNSSGSTKYDWIYLKVDATKASNPDSAADDVTTLYTSRSSLSTADDGSPPTYGLLLAIVTVANGASSISNSAITDSRVNASIVATSTTNYFFDFVESGCVWTGDSYASTLNASMTSGFIWISGKRLSVSSVSARTFTASKDTYVDLSDNNDGTASFTYTTVSNNAASPALATGAIRIAIIVTGSSSIAAAGSINQGQEDRVLPIASSIAYTVTDSLGNRICPRDPQRRLLGYRQITSPLVTAASTSDVDVTGLSVPVIAPANRKIMITLYFPDVAQSGGLGSVYTSVKVKEGSTVLAFGGTTGSAANFPVPARATVITSPSTGLHTYKGSFANNGTGPNISLDANTVGPAYLMVELI